MNGSARDMRQGSLLRDRAEGQMKAEAEKRPGPVKLEPVRKEYIWGTEDWMLSWLQEGLEDCPLLIKIIRAREALSVQVHPGDEFARTEEGKNGKTEMWYVLDLSLIHICFDASSTEIGDIEDGKLAGAIVQNPYGMGYAAAVAAFREIARMENASVIDTGYCWIDAENLSDPAVQMLIYK